VNITFAKQKLFDGINTKIWFGIAIAALISALLAIPYSSQVSGTPIPPLSKLSIDASIGLIQFIIYVFLGLKFSRKIGLESTPILSGKVKLKDNLKLSVILGVIVGLVIIVIDKLVFPVSTLPLKEGISLEMNTPGPFLGLLASFSGGIDEELFLRLLMVPFFCLIIIGILKLVGRAKNWKVTDKVAWVSIILAAILFGLGHLPATAPFMDITPLVVFRAILLNGIGGLVFGWLFYRKGIEHAMISHFSADIMLHVLLPLIGYSL
jgi:membrane protease YdiL (CAAX protease family)